MPHNAGTDLASPAAPATSVSRLATGARASRLVTQIFRRCSTSAHRVSRPSHGPPRRRERAGARQLGDGGLGQRRRASMVAGAGRRVRVGRAGRELARVQIRSLSAGGGRSRPRVAPQPSGAATNPRSGRASLICKARKMRLLPSNRSQLHLRDVPAADRTPHAHDHLCIDAGTQRRT